MRNRLPGILLALGLCMVLALPACLSPASGQPEKVPVAPSSMFFERTHHFCSDRIQDRFLIGYFGDELLDTTVYFYVISHKGDTLYRDSWAAADHLADWENPSHSDSLRTRFIQTRMRELVEGRADLPPLNIPDSTSKRLQLGPVFHYRVHEDHDRFIAFSRTQKKVVEL